MEDDRVQGIGKMPNQLVDKRTFYKQLRAHGRIGKLFYYFILFTLFFINMIDLVIIGVYAWKYIILYYKLSKL